MEKKRKLHKLLSKLLESYNVLEDDDSDDGIDYDGNNGDGRSKIYDIYYEENEKLMLMEEKEKGNK